MSELLKNTEIWEGETRTSSNFVSLEFSTEVKNQRNRSSNVRILTQKLKFLGGRGGRVFMANNPHVLSLHANFRPSSSKTEAVVREPSNVQTQFLGFPLYS